MKTPLDEYTISTELVKEVLKDEQTDGRVLTDIKIVNGNICYTIANTQVQDECFMLNKTLSLYEFAFKNCKSWAYSLEYILDSRTTDKGSCFLMTSPISAKEDVHRTFVNFDEIQAIITTCEWLILKEDL